MFKGLFMIVERMLDNLHLSALWRFQLHSTQSLSLFIQFVSVLFLFVYKLSSKAPS